MKLALGLTMADGLAAGIRRDVAGHVHGENVRANAHIGSEPIGPLNLVVAVRARGEFLDPVVDVDTHHLSVGGVVEARERQVVVANLHAQNILTSLPNQVWFQVVSDWHRRHSADRSVRIGRRSPGSFKK
jgi:hypothetical protein